MRFFKFSSKTLSIWSWTQLLEMMKKITTTETPKRHPRTKWSAVKSSFGSSSNISTIKPFHYRLLLMEQNEVLIYQKSLKRSTLLFMIMNHQMFFSSLLTIKWPNIVELFFKELWNDGLQLQYPCVTTWCWSDIQFQTSNNSNKLA